MTEIQDVRLVYGTPGDVEMTSDGGGDYASTFRLTPRGVAKIAKALGVQSFRDAEFCGCPEPRRENDGIHVAGEPVEVICLASPWNEVEHLESAVSEPDDSGSER